MARLPSRWCESEQEGITYWLHLNQRRFPSFAYAWRSRFAQKSPRPRFETWTPLDPTLFVDEWNARQNERLEFLAAQDLDSAAGPGSEGLVEGFGLLAALVRAQEQDCESSLLVCVHKFEHCVLVALLRELKASGLSVTRMRSLLRTVGRFLVAVTNHFSEPWHAAKWWNDTSSSLQERSACAVLHDTLFETLFRLSETSTNDLLCRVVAEHHAFVGYDKPRTQKDSLAWNAKPHIDWCNDLEVCVLAERIFKTTPTLVCKDTSTSSSWFSWFWPPSWLRS